MIDYSIVQGGDAGSGGNSGLTAFSDGTGNLDADPLFIDAANDDLNIPWGSPAINTGTNDGAPDADIRGLPRPAMLVTDMGAYEYQPLPPAVSLAKQVTPTLNAPYGAVVTYTLILSNTSVHSDTVRLTDTLPAQVGFGAWAESHGATVLNNEVQWLGVITESTTLTFTFTATYTYGIGLPITNTATFSGSVQAGSAEASFTLQRYTLQADTTGTGVGSVTSEPAGIDCGVACSLDFDGGQPVTLTATPLISSTFIGWSGDASGSANPCWSR
ncbi:MAG: DUF11 domain-containing protein [Anaerolineales bacterium]|nr:DUF11 domain-containing protein [Anaerolineales bacterium]